MACVTGEGTGWGASRRAHGLPQVPPFVLLSQGTRPEEPTGGPVLEGWVRRGQEGVRVQAESRMKGHRCPRALRSLLVPRPPEGRGTQDPPPVCGTRGPVQIQGADGGPHAGRGHPTGEGEGFSGVRGGQLQVTEAIGSNGLLAQHPGSCGYSPALRPAPPPQGLLWDQVCPERHTSHCIWGDLEGCSSRMMPLVPMHAWARDAGLRVCAQGWGTASLAHPNTRGKACQAGT